jgi:hypothetical protein
LSWVHARADMVLIDPDCLRQYDGEQSIRYIYRDAFQCHQLVNRSDGVVGGVFVGGEQVWDGAGFTAAHGHRQLAGSLRAVS